MQFGDRDRKFACSVAKRAAIKFSQTDVEMNARGSEPPLMDLAGVHREPFGLEQGHGSPLKLYSIGLRIGPQPHVTWTLNPIFLASTQSHWALALAHNDLLHQRQDGESFTLMFMAKEPEKDAAAEELFWRHLFE